MPRNNPLGCSGMDNGTRPPDTVLKEALLQYAKEQLTLEECLARLATEYNYTIKKTKLCDLNKEFKIPSVCKLPPFEKAAQLVLTEVMQDTNALNRGGHIKSVLANKLVPLPRAIVRKVLQDNTPEEVDSRFPGKKGLKRTTLTAIGVFAEIACDGHDKANAQALQMGKIALPMYGFSDKLSHAVLRLVVVPNNRLAQVVGHIYLDLIEEFGAIPMWLTVDGGSETGEETAIQIALRKNYAPDLEEALHPPVMKLKSTSHITIEGLWHWLQKVAGQNFVDEIRCGHHIGIFNPNSHLHVSLFYWLWPIICQQMLDQFTYWNNHHIHGQKMKSMPSGKTPRDIFTRPEAVGAEHCSILVSKEAIEQLRAGMEVSRGEAFRFVDDAFANFAHGVWENIGLPNFTVENGWTIFQQMVIDPILIEAANM